VNLMCGDCLEKMKDIADKSIDMILCDLPYGTTVCKWDVVIPFEPLWGQYKRIIKDKGAIVLTASQPFTSALVMSNTEMFKYEWIWEKSRPSGFAQAKNKPLKSHESICIFSKGVTVHAIQSSRRMTYNPQGTNTCNRTVKNSESQLKKGSDSVFSKRPSHKKEFIQNMTNYPRTVLRFASVGVPAHPTQKPVALFEYLIKTYTNEGEMVLDNCMGSGTTGVACVNLNREFVGIELDKAYFDIAKNRVESAQIKGRVIA
jgi:site-specific DNA-methyltransferase (adenine-specific)